MPKTFYIFRHGLTNAIKTGTAYGDNILTAPIIDDGKSAIERMGKYLKDKQTDYNVSSPLTRCRQTAQIVSKITGKEFVFDERLTEYHMESQASLEERIKSLLKEIDKKGYEKIAACTHGAVISAMITLLTGGQQTYQYATFIDPDPGVLVIIKDKNFEEISFN